MRRRGFAWAAALVLLLLAQSGWGFSDVGALFELGMGARPLGMGGAFVALADDENASVANPAGLGWQKRLGVGSLFVQGYGGTTYGALGIALPWFGAAVMQIDSGLIASGETSFRYVSQAAVLSCGVSVGGLGLGGRVKLLGVSEPFQAKGMAFDPAILLVGEGIRVGLLFENLVSSPVVESGGQGEDWTPALRVGAAITGELEGIRWTLLAEALDLLSPRVEVRAGFEAWVEGLAARAGYDGAAPSIGLSARFDSFQIDWAYCLSTDLGGSHRVSIVYRF